MSTFKKVISLVLCLSMLTGVFAVLGAPIASAANISTLKTPVTHTIRSVSELDTQYGDRGYYYLGLEFYEYGEDGESLTLTDGYVTPGQKLQVRVYTKTSFYINDASTYFAFDRNFFDISNGMTRVEDKTGNNGNNTLSTESKPTDIKYYTEGKNGRRTSLYYANLPNISANTEYKISDGNDGETSLNLDVKTIWAGNETAYFKDADSTNEATSPIGFDLATVRGWDLCEIMAVRRSDSVQESFKLNSDQYIYAFDIKVRQYIADNSTEELSNGTTGSTVLGMDAFKLYGKINPDDDKVNYRRSDAYVGATATDRTLGMLDNELIYADNLDIVDCNWTFVIGENPVPEDTYSAVFADADGEILSSGNYAANATVVPPTVTKDGAKLIAWVDTETGEKLDVTDSGSVIIPAKNGIYKPLFDTDKFKITFDLGGGKLDDQTTYEKEVAYGEDVNLQEIVPVKEHNTLVAWLVKTGPGNGYISNGTYKHECVNDVTVSAVWSKTEYNIKFMIMDYSAGDWKEYTVKSGYYGDKAIDISNDIVSKIKASDANWSGTIDARFTGVYDATARKQTGTIEYDSNKTYYIYTTVKYDLTVRVPTYDTQNHEYTDEFTTLYEGTVFGGANTGIYTYVVSTDDKESVVNNPGEGYYELTSWTDSEGNAFDFTDNGLKFNVTPQNGPVVVATANYRPYEYQVCFVTKENRQVLYSLPTKVGETIDLTKGELKYKVDNDKTIPAVEFTFPVEGVESTEQPEGARRWAPAGYRFDGWYTSRTNQTEETRVTFPLEVTKSTVSGTYKITGAVGNVSKERKTLLFYPKWTPLEYDVEFYITNESNEEQYYTKMRLAVGENIGGYINSISDEVRAEVNAKAPEGMTFTVWRAEETYVPKGGMKVYAQYTETTYAIYIDYNNNKEGDAPYKFGNAIYGADPEFEPAEVGAESGAGYRIRKMPVYSNNKPVGNYEIIGWNVYYLDDPADISNPEKWHEGYSSSGERKAYAPIVYQAQWISHSDLLFRTYDTAGNLYSALSKSFKRYYWSNGTSCEKSAASLNAYPETQFVAFITPSLENFEWSGFFSADMWSKVSLRFDAKGLANGTFSPENIVQIIKLLIAVIKGEQELPEM